MNAACRKLRLEQMEGRDCPSAGPAVVSPPPAAAIPPAVTADLANLTAELNNAAADFVSQAQPVVTEVVDAIKAMADTAKLAFDVRAQTHASVGGVVAPLVHVGMDEAKLYFDFTTGNTAGAETAAANEQNDLATLGNSLTGTENPGLAAAVFSQVETAFNNANETLFGTDKADGVAPAVAESPTPFKNATDGGA